MKQLNLSQIPLESLEKSILIKGNNIAVTFILSYQEEMAKGKINTLSGRIRTLLSDSRAMNTWQISKSFWKSSNCLTAPIRKMLHSWELIIVFLGKATNYYKQMRYYKLTSCGD